MSRAESPSAREAMTKWLLPRGTAQNGAHLRGENDGCCCYENENALDGGTPLSATSPTISAISNAMDSLGDVDLLIRPHLIPRPHGAKARKRAGHARLGRTQHAQCQKHQFHHQSKRRKGAKTKKRMQRAERKHTWVNGAAAYQRQHPIPALLLSLLFLYMRGIATEIILVVAGLCEVEGGGAKTASSASAVTVGGSWLVVRPEERGRGRHRHREAALRGVLTLILAGVGSQSSNWDWEK
ncbi:hypothetical protein MSAN_02277300 [Mycena sanguinolenta]|uniref:Uncharacterized protein n=1 Tax=Mycena sanguinolenta TaxID=230812 RepID=A0A8H6X9Q7_9AGAR|nr:hypothetical protein MSAN_02277300 [Mycena sanguinolenta]